MVSHTLVKTSEETLIIALGSCLTIKAASGVASVLFQQPTVVLAVCHCSHRGG